MARSIPKILRVAGWTLIFLILPTLTIVFWAPFGLAVLLAIPIIGIIAVLRSLVLDLMGKRPEHSYVVGAIRMSHLQKKEVRIRHFSDSANRTAPDRPAAEDNVMHTKTK